MPSSTEPQPAQALKLRQELKDWERAFANSHDGRKPTREEIKKDAKISAKYKQYSKFRGSTSTTSSTTSSSSRPSSSNRPYAPPSSSTLSYEDNPFAPSASFASTSVSSASASRASSIKSARSQRRNTDDIFKTPSKPYHNDLYDSPLSTRGRRLFGNRPRDSVGPTPQKMGKILGIFESFVDVETTPTHQRVLRGTPGTGNKRAEERVSASPAVTGDPFSTPRKRKAHDLSSALGSGSECDSPTKQTPKDVLSTPAFLRRNNQFAPAAFLDSPPVPQPLRPPVRGLSTMVAELRKMEDDAHGDEEEAMREMEEEMMGPPPAPPPAGASATKPKKVKPAMVDNDNDPDTGLPPPPSGAWADDTLQEELPSGGEKVSAPKWKKKGLKRQHRRVIMRPVRRIAHPDDPSCPPPPPNPEEVELPAAGYDDEDLSDLDTPAVSAAPEPESNDPREAARAKRAKTMAEDVAGKSKETVKKVARKISEKAHANYKRVNIRGSKGAKAGNGGGRFSRKRR